MSYQEQLRERRLCAGRLCEGSEVRVSQDCGRVTVAAGRCRVNKPFTPRRNLMANAAKIAHSLNPLAVKCSFLFSDEQSGCLRHFSPQLSSVILPLQSSNQSGMVSMGSPNRSSERKAVGSG